MQRFRAYITEGPKVVIKSVKDVKLQNQSAFKSYLTRTLKSVKFTSAPKSRGGYHIRFALDPKKFNQLTKQGIDIQEYPGPSVSSKFDTYVLIATRDLSPQVPFGSMILYANNFIGAGKTGGLLFNNKDLSPDNLGFAGQTHTASSIMKKLKVVLYKNYDKAIADQLMDMANAAATGRNNSGIKNTFSTKDLAKVSADYGEILSALFAMKRLRFKQSFFPLASNEPLIDFYGIRFGVRYPISVKSGGGGKVTIQNIINAIENRAKKASAADISKEPSLNVFKLVKTLPMKEQMIELHKYRDTDSIKQLAKIMGTSVKNVNLKTLKAYTDSKTNAELITELKPFWKTLNMKLEDKTLQGADKLRLVISPLGESIWKILNADKEIKESLTRVARQVTLIQVNVDVRKSGITFQNNYFKDAEFEFGWAGYAAGNKLGFKMKIKR